MGREAEEGHGRDLVRKFGLYGIRLEHTVSESSGAGREMQARQMTWR